MLSEVPIVDMDADKILLQGADGRTFREAVTNIWVDAAAAPEVAYLGTGRHGGGIILRPLFSKANGAWSNVTTGKEAPAELSQKLNQA